MRGFYVYRFIDSNKNIIYVGRTTNLKQRLDKQHFTLNGHLPEECYNETSRIEFAELNNENTMKIYEIYYISKYKPKYNSEFNIESDIPFTLPEIKWKEYKTLYSQDLIVIEEKTSKEMANKIRRYNENAIHLISRVRSVVELVSSEIEDEVLTKILNSLIKDVEVLKSFDEYTYHKGWKKFVRIKKSNKEAV